MVGPRLPVAAGRLRRGLAPGNASRDAATALAGTRIVFQPIVAVANGSLFGAEALTRFGRRVGTGPQDVFGDAHAAGFGAELELTSLHAALLRRRDLPA